MQQQWPGTLWVGRHGQSAGNVAPRVPRVRVARGGAGRAATPWRLSPLRQTGLRTVNGISICSDRPLRSTCTDSAAASAWTSAHSMAR